MARNSIGKAELDSGCMKRVSPGDGKHSGRKFRLRNQSWPEGRVEVFPQPLDG